MPCEFLVGFWEIGTHSRTCEGCHMSTFGSGHDKFIGIKTIKNFKFSFDFYESSGYRLYSLHCLSCSWNWISILYEDKWILHHKEDAVDHEGLLWTRRLPRHHTLLLYRKSPKSNLNFEWLICKYSITHFFIFLFLFIFWFLLIVFMQC